LPAYAGYAPDYASDKMERLPEWFVVRRVK
jgi:hypothetical protein